MSGKTPEPQPKPSVESHGGSNARGTGRTQGKRGNGAQKLQQKTA